MEYKTKVVALRFTPTEHRAMSRFIGKVVDEVNFVEVKPKNIGELIHWMMQSRMEEMLVNDRKELKKAEAKAKRLAKKEAASGSEEYWFNVKTWDEWVQANPNLVNIEPAMFWSTVGKEWNKFELGWIELGDDSGL